jgi:hypothetical protein
MSKSSLRQSVFVDECAEWALALTQRECRGPGDMENAWRRLEARYQVPTTTFWALRYRKPKDILASVYFRLREAYETECNRQIRKLQHELEITKAKAGAAHPVVVSVEALVRENGGPE